MRINPALLQELLETTRMYVTCPYNSIFMFVIYPEYQTLKWFNEHIASGMTYARGYSPVVLELIKDIQRELYIMDGIDNNTKLKPYSVL